MPVLDTRTGIATLPADDKITPFSGTVHSTPGLPALQGPKRQSPGFWSVGHSKFVCFGLIAGSRLLREPEAPREDKLNRLGDRGRLCVGNFRIGYASRSRQLSKVEVGRP